jgi:hypothetical protein
MTREWLVCMKCGQMCSPRRYIPKRCKVCGAFQPWTFTDDKGEAIAIKKNIRKGETNENR